MKYFNNLIKFRSTEQQWQHLVCLGIKHFQFENFSKAAN